MFYYFYFQITIILFSTSIILFFYLQTDNEDLKKYAHCMLVKSELMTKDGKFKKDVALAKVPNAGKLQSPRPYCLL